jgi:hypothetical protein
MSHSGEKMDEKERVCPFLPNIQQKTFCNILSKKAMGRPKNVLILLHKSPALTQQFTV